MMRSRAKSTETSSDGGAANGMQMMMLHHRRGDGNAAAAAAAAGNDTDTDEEDAPLMVSSSFSPDGNRSNNRAYRQNRNSYSNHSNGNKFDCDYFPSIMPVSRTCITVALVVLLTSGFLLWGNYTSHNNADKNNNFQMTPFWSHAYGDNNANNENSHIHSEPSSSTGSTKNNNKNKNMNANNVMTDPFASCTASNGNTSSSSSVAWKTWLQMQSARAPAERCGPLFHARPLRDGTLTTCKCHSPVVPWDRSNESPTWSQAFARNKALVRDEIKNYNSNQNNYNNNASNQQQQQQQRPLDIVFLGDSITEHWLGPKLFSVFEEFFNSSQAPLRALALGIGGDRTTNLLYRILGGELPPELHARLYWVLIGTNDLGGEQCSVDMVTAGILGIVQVMLQATAATANSQVVVNGILPRDRRSVAKSPLMNEITAINQRLECYVKQQQEQAAAAAVAGGMNDARLHFYNATDIFLTSDKQYVNMTLMPDALHPSELGSRLWAENMTAYALDLLVKLPPVSTPLSQQQQPAMTPSLPADEESSSTAMSQLPTLQPAIVPRPTPSGKFPTTSCPHNYIRPQKSWKDWIEQQGSDTVNHCEMGVGNKDHCSCSNPIRGVHRDIADWDVAHQRNQDLANNATNKLDVVFLGDSIIEFWTGYKLGRQNLDYSARAKLFEDLFASNTSRIKGVGLGISGDRCNHLQWRIENGEVPETLESSIYWILIGTNDLMDRCSVDSITAGVLEVVAAVRRQKPDATIVINSLLPRGREPLLESPFWKILSAVNGRLECFVSQQSDKKLIFFNATDLFVSPGLMLNQEIMPDALHPSAEGYQIWGNKIVEKVLEILSQRVVPEPPSAAPTATLETPESCQDSYILPQQSWKDWIALQGTVQDRCEVAATNETCTCQNPLEADPITDSPSWSLAHQRNKEIAGNVTTSLDLVLLGDSIIEFWATGQCRAQQSSELLPSVEVFETLFSNSASSVKGIGLGISGDQTHHLLWRIQNGELPDTLDSSVYWILIGTNDWGVGSCSADMITAGAFEVISTVRRKKPNSTIVVNSLLPRGSDPLLESVPWKVFSSVNERLECFASLNDKIVFFNATDLFLAPGPVINHSIMPDFVHPNADGFQTWGSRIVEKVLEIVK